MRARLHLRPDAGEIRVAEKPREEGDRQKRHEDRTHAHLNPLKPVATLNPEMDLL